MGEKPNLFFYVNLATNATKKVTQKQSVGDSVKFAKDGAISLNIADKGPTRKK